jgi:hypothetical protein
MYHYCNVPVLPTVLYLLSSTIPCHVKRLSQDSVVMVLLYIHFPFYNVSSVVDVIFMRKNYICDNLPRASQAVLEAQASFFIPEVTD